MSLLMADTAPADLPMGEVGPLTLTRRQRAARGRFAVANTESVVVDKYSAAFWAAQDGARREIITSVLEDAGHRVDDAPRALRLAAEGIAQATLLRDSAYARVVEAGGPLTSNGRTRRAFNVWLETLDRLERHLRLVGLKRASRRTNIAEQFAQHHAAQREGTK